MAIYFKSENNRCDAFNVRANVFMVEQGFSYDFDRLDDDDRVLHITAYDDGANAAYATNAPNDSGLGAKDESGSSDGHVASSIGTARIFPACLEWQYPRYLDASKDGWVVGRIAVMPHARHSGLGSLILEEAERQAFLKGADEMHLHAQVRAMPFYKKMGYEEYGGLEDDEGVPHQWMRKKLA